jgi:arylsulfatase A-like enzyme
MTRRQFLAATSGAAASPELPNFIVILADDQGYGDLGCYGSPYIRTPNLDRMARQGMRFTDFYAQPMCGPSRAALLTGCYPVRNSLMFNHLPRARTGIHPNEITIADALKTRGYATAIVGKWHLGDAPQFLPLRHGFDYYFGFPYSNDMWPFHPKIRPTAGENPRLTQARRRAEMTGFDGRGQVYPTDWFPDLPLMENDRVVELNPDQSRITGRYTEQGIEFIRRNRQRPFFLYLAFSMPHVPLFPGKHFDGRSMRGRYGDTVEEIDACVGRILKLVQELDLDRRTMVVYSSDNGPWLPYGVDAGSAGPLRGGKGSVWEGGVRVPAVLRWPGRVPEGAVCSEVAANLDLLPTFAGLSGAALPVDHKIDGHDLRPLLAGREAKSRREAFFFYGVALQYRAEEGRPGNLRLLQAVRKGRWKLHGNLEAGRFRGAALYDLWEDVGETKDLAASHRGLVVNLESLATTFDQDLARNVRPLGRIGSELP